VKIITLCKEVLLLGRSRVLDEGDIKVALDHQNFEGGYVSYSRICTRGMLLQGTRYKRMEKKRNNIVAYKHQGLDHSLFSFFLF